MLKNIKQKGYNVKIERLVKREMLISSSYLKGQRINKLFPSGLLIRLRAASQQIALQPAAAAFEPCGV